MQLGEKLKEARMNQNLTIEEVQEETKIQKRYLIAIEDNDWSKVPGIFYVRAFIREYANAVGLDADHLLEEHRDELPVSDTKKVDYMSPSTKGQNVANKINRTFLMFLPKLLVLLLVIAVLFAIYYFYISTINPSTDEPDENPDVITAPDEDLDEEENNDVDEEIEEEPIEEEPESIEQSLNVVSSDETLSAPRTVYELTNAEQFVLTIEVTDETYLHVHGLNENNQVVTNHFQAMFTSNDSPMTIDASDDERIELNIGRASSTTVYINDEILEYEVDPNAKVHQFITIIWNNEEN